MSIRWTLQMKNFASYSCLQIRRFDYGGCVWRYTVQFLQQSAEYGDSIASHQNKKLKGHPMEVWIHVKFMDLASQFSFLFCFSFRQFF